MNIIEENLIIRIKEDYQRYHRNDFKRFEILLKDLNQKTQCPNCGSPYLVSFGKSASGSHRYRCRDCRKTFSTSTGSLSHSSKVNIDAWFVFLECILSGTSVRAASIAAKIAPKTGSEWMSKIFVSLKDYQESIKLSSPIYVDETYVHVDKSRIYYTEEVGKRKKVRKLPRGISRNMICILVATDSRRSIARILNEGRPQRLNVFRQFAPHIKEGSHIIGDEDNALTYTAKKLSLTRTVYKSNTQEAYDNLEPVGQLCDRIKFFIGKHRGFKKDLLQDYLNLAIFIDNEKSENKDLYTVTEKLLKRIFSYSRDINSSIK
ncbi:MAG: IS1 family transposase [Erysipelotrichaceae bacterium]|nr:IS1 family transposase [Erysipelotrichaceae bacterium]